MKTFLAVSGIIAAWFILQFYVLPRMGIST